MAERRLLLLGLGPIGRAAGALAAQRGFQIVAAIDRDPRLVGRDLGEFGQLRAGVRVEPQLEPALERARPHVVLHATGSRLDDVLPQLEACAARGVHVVSSCEELAYPWRTQPELARRLDEVARAGGVAILGSGVNPGFLMDKFVVTLLAACARVERVGVRRALNAATRRRPFQDKIGVGLTRSEFDEALRAGRIGHVGFAESAHMVADVIGVPEAREIEERLEPVIAAARTIAGACVIGEGRVLGIRQQLVLRSAGREWVCLELQAYAGARAEDGVTVEGEPPLRLFFEGGVPGDLATAARLANDLFEAERLEPGLRTLLDVAIRHHPPRESGGQD